MIIWFNHWFSTAYHLINMMREGREDCRVIGSGRTETTVFREACDEWFVEPTDISDNDYADWCVEFAKAHSVDVFVPRRALVEIISRADKFEAIGTRLFADKNADLAVKLDDKIETYKLFEKSIPEIIPPVFKATNISEFKSACENIQSSWKRACYKLAIDEGASTFRVIDETIEDASALHRCAGSKITMAAALKVLSGYDFSIPILVMPYLYGYEISCDCLETSKGRIIIPRYKMGSRYSKIKPNAEIIGFCNRIMDTIHLTMPMNIQFRCHEDTPYLLEINPRMSGGLQLSCKAADVNIPAIALSELLGENAEFTIPEIIERQISNIEYPILLGG